jgi:Raf kinase inhibitor-like YbhB/YbcL family protein
MKLFSPAFKEGERIPVKYTMPAVGGKNISIPLDWDNAPQGTRSFALIMVDPHPIADNWVHWMVINIPPEVSSLLEGASQNIMPAGAVELQNSFRDLGYGGPRPPRGTGDHPYVTTLYALSVEELKLGVNTNLSEFTRELQGKVLQEASLTGKFGV